MKTIDQYEWRIAWNNPYTTPPEGRDRVLYTIVSTSRTMPPEIDTYRDDPVNQAGPGSGYGIHFRHIPPPIKRMSQEQCAKIRRRNLERRLKKRYPMFADQFIEQELQRRPDYFSGACDLESEKKLREAGIIQ